MSDEVRAARRRLALRAAGGGLAWSLGLLLTAVLIPLYDGQTSSDANGLTLSTATYVQRNGAWVLIPLLAPLIAAVAVAVAVARPAPGLRRAALAAVAGVTVLGVVLVTSGGILLLPVAILLGGALRLTRPARSGRSPGSGRARGTRPGAGAGRGRGTGVDADPGRARGTGPGPDAGPAPTRSRRRGRSAPRTES
jgi:hypothetical protein